MNTAQLRAAPFEAASFNSVPVVSFRNVRVVLDDGDRVTLELMNAKTISLDAVYQAVLEATKGMKLSKVLADETCEEIHKASLIEQLSQRLVLED